MINLPKYQPDQLKIMEKDQEKKEVLKNFKAWALAGELGYIIAVPIVAFALIGRFADKAWGTSPWLLLAGILISIIISSWLIYKKVREIL